MTSQNDTKLLSVFQFRQTVHDFIHRFLGESLPYKAMSFADEKNSNAFSRIFCIFSPLWPT